MIIWWGNLWYVEDGSYFRVFLLIELKRCVVNQLQVHIDLITWHHVHRGIDRVTTMMVPKIELQPQPQSGYLRL